jgi:hypothetical protein
VYHKDETSTDEAETCEEFGDGTSGEITRWRIEVEQEIRRQSEYRESGEEVAPLFVDHGREHTFLMMHRHHNPRHKDNQSRERIIREALLFRRLRRRIRRRGRRTNSLVRRFPSGSSDKGFGRGVEKATDRADFNEDPTETSPHKHDCDGDVFEILMRPFSFRVAEMFHKLLGGAVDKDGRRFNHFGRRSTIFPLFPRQGTRWFEIPSPSEIGKDTAIPSERDDPVIEKDAAYPLNVGLWGDYYL